MKRGSITPRKKDNESLLSLFSNAGGAKALRAFTMMEVLVVVALIGVVALFTTAVDTGTLIRSDINSEANTLAELLTRARNQSMNNVNEAPHGVYVSATEFILFEGTDYASAVSEQATPRDAQVTGGNGSEVVFTQLSGATTATTIILSSSAENVTVAINSEGRIDW